MQASESKSVSSAGVSKYLPDNDAPPGTLANNRDAYNSRYIASEALPLEREAFSKALAATLLYFRAQTVKGVFLDLSLAQAPLLEEAVAQGFKLHHCRGDQLLCLVQWLPASPSRLPAYASHYMGVGGLVLDLNHPPRLLVIKEKSGNCTTCWKIPGGLVDAGEYLSKAVEREVLEETGVKASFEGVLALRENTDYHFGKSDLYVICLLSPLSKELQACEIEVAHCEWMEVETFAKQQFRVETQKIIAELALSICQQASKTGEVSFERALKDREVSSIIKNKTNRIYLPEKISIKDHQNDSKPL